MNIKYKGNSLQDKISTILRNGGKVPKLQTGMEGMLLSSLAGGGGSGLAGMGSGMAASGGSYGSFADFMGGMGGMSQSAGASSAGGNNFMSGLMNQGKSLLDQGKSGAKAEGKSIMENPDKANMIADYAVMGSKRWQERQNANKPKTNYDYLQQAGRQSTLGDIGGGLGGGNTKDFINTGLDIIDPMKREEKLVNEQMGITAREIGQTGKGGKLVSSGLMATGDQFAKYGGPKGKLIGAGLKGAGAITGVVANHFDTKGQRLLNKKATAIDNTKGTIAGDTARGQSGMDWLVSKKGGTLRINKYECGKPKMKFLKGGVIPMFSKGSVILGGQRHHEGNPVHGKGNPGIDPSTGEKQFETEKGELLLNIQQTEMLNQAVAQGDSYGIGVVMAEILSNTIDNSGEYAKS